MAIERALTKLPVEIRDMVREQADDTISLEEANRQRLRLLKERRMMAKQKDSLFEYGSFCLA